jgi:hypothetical protein
VCPSRTASFARSTSALRQRRRGETAPHLAVTLEALQLSQLPRHQLGLVVQVVAVVGHGLLFRQPRLELLGLADNLPTRARASAALVPAGCGSGGKQRGAHRFDDELLGLLLALLLAHDLLPFRLLVLLL